MSEVIDGAIDQIIPLWQATDEVLDSWNSEGNLQFPDLLGKLAVKLNWTDKQLREYDPIIRFFVRRHPAYHVTRGAHGGIMRKSDKERRELAKTLKDSVKKQMQAELAVKIAEISARMAAENAETPDKSEE